MYPNHSLSAAVESGFSRVCCKTIRVPWTTAVSRAIDATGQTDRRVPWFLKRPVKGEYKVLWRVWTPRLMVPGGRSWDVGTHELVENRIKKSSRISGGKRCELRDCQQLKSDIEVLSVQMV